MAKQIHNVDTMILTINDLKEAGLKKLSKILKDNEAAFNRYKTRPRILVNVSRVDMTTTIFGTKVTFPLGFAPAAMHKLAHPEGELATSRAAARGGIAMGLSSWATCSMGNVIAEGKGNPYAFQVTLVNDRNVNLKMLKRAEKAGYKAILLTVDGVVLGRRLSELRNDFSLPQGVKYPNVESKAAPRHGVNPDDDSLNYAMSTGKVQLPGSRLTPAYLSGSREVCQIWFLCLRRDLIEVVYTPEDVTLAVQYGIDGIIISSHGRRQLDSVPATLDALRECAPAAVGKIPIAIDGGIRRASDIFKALAMGACFCFVGRVPIWGLAYTCPVIIEASYN